MYYSTVSSDVDQPIKAIEFWCTVEKACYLEMNPIYIQMQLNSSLYCQWAF